MEINTRSEYIRRSVSKYVNFAILIVLLFLLSPRVFEMVKLGINRTKWHFYNVEHYRFQLNALCHCLQMDITPVTIEVLNGKVVAITGEDGTHLEQNAEYLSVLGDNKTAEGLFDQIQRENFKDDVIQVTYDGKNGFPLVMIFDRIRNGIDDELVYVVKNFEVLP